MRRRLLLLLLAPLLPVVGCAASSPPPAGAQPPVRLLIAGIVDLAGDAGVVARADAEGVFREIRLAARRADLAIVITAEGGGEALLAAAGFDAVACPERRDLGPGTAPGRGTLQVVLGCSGGPAWASPLIPSPLLDRLVVAGAGDPAGAGGDLLVAGNGGELAAVIRPRWPGRGPLAVSGLGVLLSGEAATEGALLEVLADEGGVIAYRLGRVTHGDFRVHFSGWDLPGSDAVLLAGEWWSLARSVTPAPAAPPPALGGFAYGEVSAVAAGDVTGDGVPDLAVSYRHPFRPTALSEARPGAVGVDSLGRSAHLGVFTAGGEARWAAGFIPHPVGALAACDGSVALAYTGLDDPAVVAAGAAVWQGFALSPAPELPGPGIPACADVDGDGHLDPVILGRAS